MLGTTAHAATEEIPAATMRAMKVLRLIRDLPL